MLPLIGGSGGSGGGIPGLDGTGGGAGGGAIAIASNVSITINDTITAGGGSAPNINLSNIRQQGGGGSGGAIRLLAPTITGSGTLLVNGGTAGGVGRVLLEAFQNTFSGSATGDFRAITLPPNPILFPTASSSSIRVESIDGVAAPISPRGNFKPVDVNITAAQSVDIVLEGKNVPVRDDH